MTDAARRARRATVGECMALLPIEPLLLDQDEDPLRIVRLAAARPETRLIGVTDASGVLVGVVPMLRLAETVVARVCSRASPTSPRRPASARRSARGGWPT
jgi:hypothetical protein